MVTLSNIVAPCGRIETIKSVKTINKPKHIPIEKSSV